MTYDRSTVLPIANKQTFTYDKYTVSPVTKSHYWAVTKTHRPIKQLLQKYRLLCKFGLPFTVAQVVSGAGTVKKVVGSSPTQVAFFLENISNSIFLCNL